jgi:predicted nucleotidyltransferase
VVSHHPLSWTLKALVDKSISVSLWFDRTRGGLRVVLVAKAGLRTFSRVVSTVLSASLRLSLLLERATVAILGVALFGSRAREDGDAASDTDLLALTTDRQPKYTVRNGVVLSSFPYGLMLHRAGLGDLFVLHINTEATVIYQSSAFPVFKTIKDAFRYKDDYFREIGLPSDLGWFLLRFGDRLRSAKLLNARMAWVTRTILIARAAAQQRPIFGAGQLAEFSGSPDVLTLIENRHSGERDPSMTEKFAAFIRSHGAREPRMPRNLEEQKQFFLAERNITGLRLVERIMQH